MGSEDVTGQEKREPVGVDQCMAILENSPMLIFLKDIEGRYLYVNRQFEESFHLSRSQTLGRTDAELFSPAQAAAFRTNDLEVLRAGRSLAFEEHASYGDDLHTSIVQKFPLMDQDGKVFALCGIVTDITERKKMESALRESAASFRMMVRCVKEYAIFMLDSSGFVVNWNEGAQRIKGYRDEEIIGKHFSCFYPPEEIERGTPIHGLTMAAEQGTYRDQGWRVRKDGSRFWAAVVITAMRDEAGKLLGFTKVTRDLTEQKRLEDEREQMSRIHTAELGQRVAERTARLEEANADLEEFVYFVSHDLRTPLRTVQRFAEILLDEYGDHLDPNGADYAQRIVSSAESMDMFIQELLAYSRLSQREIRPMPVSLKQVVETAVADMHNEMAEKGATVACEGELPIVLGHEVLLVQVVKNLLSNALKFVRPEVTPRVRIWCEEMSDQCRLWIEDNGIGIAPELHERIFKAFERLHGVETYPGTGVGLAVVKKGIARLGGTVGVESETGKGSMFWVQLPKAKAARPPRTREVREGVWHER